MSSRTSHQKEVSDFLEREFKFRGWEFSLPHGWGKESYYAHGDGTIYFIKLGVRVANYMSTASSGLTPPVLATGTLKDGTTILVQQCIEAKKPTWSDFQCYPGKFAEVIRTMQHSVELRHILPEPKTEKYCELGLREMALVRQRWDHHAPKVPKMAGWVDKSLDQLAVEIQGMDGEGAVVAHHDICNANWLISATGQIYLIDLDDLRIDDPAADLGALLWWYYPPELRERFLETVGYPYNAQFRQRMRLRMAIHCLSILLPREGSFDRFNADDFVINLTDFRAILAGEENPQGYG